MRSHLRALTDRLSFYEWVYGRMAEADSDLGPIAEYLVGSALGCLPESRRVSAPYDLILPDGRTVEVKATAKRQTMSRGRPPIYRWKVAAQFSDPNKKLADLWFFLIADFPVSAPRRFDVFDPKYWTARVVTGSELATTGITRYISMKISVTALRKLQRNNAHVADCLDAYRRMGKVDFAVMITGPWVLLFVG